MTGWRHSRWWLGLAAALLVTAWAWLPWLDPRLNPWARLEGLHDGKNHLLRLYVLEWMIRHGAWYPRWVPDLFMGNGYPVFNFYAPASYYLALFLKTLLRLDTWDGFRAAGVAAAVVGASGAYALTVALWGRVSLGILAALILLYSPYVFQVNLHRRGDVPEVLALALAPWLLLAIWRLWAARTATQTAAWLGTAGGVGAGLLLTHNLTALVGAALAALWTGYLLLSRPSRRGVLLVILAGALAAGASAFFWLPAIGERDTVQLEWLQFGSDYRDYFLDPGGRSFSQDHPDNKQTRGGVIDLNLRYPHQMIAPPMASLAQAGLALVTIAGVAGAIVTRRVVGPVLPLLVAALGSWFLTLSVSAPVWRVIPVLPLMQFPSRLLGPAGVCLALAAAGTLAWPAALLERRYGARGRLAAHVLVGLVGGAVLFNSLGGRELPLADEPSRAVNGDVLLYDELNDVIGMGTTTGREFMPRIVFLPTYTSNAPRGRAVFERLYPEGDWSGGLLLPLGGDLRLLSWRTASGSLAITARVANDGPMPAALAVRQVGYPGWRAWLDGWRVPVELSPYVVEQQATPGFMVVQVPPGEHTISLAFGPTPLRLAGMGITLLTGLSGITGLALVLHKQRRWRPGGVVVMWLVVAGCLCVLTWRGVRPMFLRFSGAPTASVSAVGGVWQAPDLSRSLDGHGQGGLVVNVAEAARTGAARIESPSGASLGPNAFVDVRQLTVTDGDDPERGLAGTSRRQWLYMHPPSTVSVDVALPAAKNVWLQAALTLDPTAWDSPVGDGVRYQALIARLAPDGTTSGEQVVLDRTVNPRARREQRRWLPVEADLAPWAGTTVRLTLKTLPLDTLSFDWAGWGNPVVAVRETARSLPPTVPS